MRAAAKCLDLLPGERKASISGFFRLRSPFETDEWDRLQRQTALACNQMGSIRRALSSVRCLQITVANETASALRASQDGVGERGRPPPAASIRHRALGASRRPLDRRPVAVQAIGMSPQEYRAAIARH